jgi:catechol 2,3-dioxygenase-like lactoylglutathione lyase family enzyme
LGHPAKEENLMMRLTAVKLFVHDQEEALRFYVDRVGFVVSEDNMLGDFRWLLVRAPDTPDVAVGLVLAKTPEQQALVGRQGGGEPVFGLTTDDCQRDYLALKTRGVAFDGEPRKMPFGIGVALQDLYGNKLYLNQDPH